MQMIKNEFKFIFKNKLIAISLLAIMFIPFMYSIFFLKSVWDPYGTTQNLPIAVVNKDQAVEFHGQKMHAGDDMVKELQKNKQLGWRFVSPEKAEQGLKDQEYYSVITLPENFSKNATSVLDNEPKKMQIQFKTNDSLNYIGEVISEVGASTLNTQIRQAVTTAYANTMFDQVKEAGKGFKDAATGAQQLNDGSVALTDGLKVYTSGVDQVNNGVMTLKTGVTPLASGVNQLTAGSGQLNTGLQTLNGKTGELAAGTKRLADGSGELQNGLGQYTDGVGTLSDGLGQLSKTGKDSNINGQVTKLANGVAALQAGSLKINAKLNELQTKLDENPTLASDQKYQEALAGYQAAQKQLQGMQATLSHLDTALQPIVNQVAGQDYSTKAQGIINTEKAAGVTFTPEQETKIKAGLTQQLKASAVDEAKQIVAGVATTVQGQVSSQDLQKLEDAMQQSAGMLQNLKKIQTGLDGIPGDAQNPGLVAGMHQLNQGIDDLQAGTKDMPTQMQKYTGTVDALASGSAKLNQNSGQLNSGAQQLANGTQQLNGQVPALTGGVSQLANGSQALFGGLSQMQAQIPTLTSGVDQLALGTNQLAGNSSALLDGSNQLSDGSGVLSKALKAGSDQVGSIKLGKKNAEQFAAPSELKHSHYSDVPNYGHALAPYVLSVALFVGAIVFNFAFPIRKISMPGQSATAWFFSKIIIGGIMAVAMGLIEPGLMMLAGLHFDHPAQVFTISVMYALASMAIVMFLSMAFDNPGRFLAMVLLMLQLGGSGGTFPMQVTNHFYNVIHPYLPMTYSILGLRQGITSGLGAGQISESVIVLTIFTLIGLILLWISMVILQRIGLAGKSQLDNNQELQAVEH
ncbi:YhgE/Pip family protein [Weissella kandleri]|uniref:YhgE/Pip family protein n=1 Tax=Weissella kandleri TaxID=1616 RepID=UPI00387ED31C